MIRGGSVRPLALACAAHAVLTAVLFADVLFLGRVPYFRDVSSWYYPHYEFAASALRQGVWPLWNPTFDAGTPFLMAYPVELLMLAVTGARHTLMLSPLLHVWLAMCSATLLARELGWSRRAAWLSGAVFGLSGVLQSALNLVPLAQGAAWAPLVLAAYLRCFRRPGARSAVLLGVVAALQASTLAGEIVLQTALFALVLTPTRPARAQWRALAGAGVLAAALGAPVIAGMRAILEGTPRASGFGAGVVLSWSVHPLALLEMVWPRFLGDPHTMTDLGYWGQPFFPDGYPYFISLYLGPLVLALAACAGRAWRSRLWALAGAGVLLALGSYGPLGAALTVALPQFRAPVKYLFLTALALSLLAGSGLDAAAEARRKRAMWALGVPAALFLVLGLALSVRAVETRSALGAIWTRLLSAEAEPLAALWAPALLQTGLLAGLACAALGAGRRLAFAPAACLIADLLATNARIDPAAPADFYDLRPEMVALIRQAPQATAHRWFTYGVANTRGITWSPALLARNQDSWLYYMDRQVLWGATKALDGLDGAFDEDRTGWSPRGSTFSPAESRPERHAQNHDRLRLAGVRFVLSFAPLPPDLALPRAEARLPGVQQPLVLHELRDALPRAFFVPDCEVAGSEEAAWKRIAEPSFDPRARVVLPAPPPGPACGTASPAGRSEVRWQRDGPQAYSLEADGDAGYLVFLEGHHRDWRVESPASGVSLMRADGRYCALSVPSGHTSIRLRFRPSWVWPSIVLASLAALAALVLGLWPAGKLDTSSSVALASDD